MPLVAALGGLGCGALPPQAPVLETSDTGHRILRGESGPPARFHGWHSHSHALCALGRCRTQGQFFPQCQVGNTKVPKVPLITEQGSCWEQTQAGDRTGRALDFRSTAGEHRVGAPAVVGHEYAGKRQGKQGPTLPDHSRRAPRGRTGGRRARTRQGGGAPGGYAGRQTPPARSAWRRARPAAPRASAAGRAARARRPAPAAAAPRRPRNRAASAAPPLRPATARGEGRYLGLGFGESLRQLTQRRRCA